MWYHGEQGTVEVGPYKMEVSNTSIIAQIRSAATRFPPILDFRTNAQFFDGLMVNMTKTKGEICCKIPLSFWGKT